MKGLWRLYSLTHVLPAQVLELARHHSVIRTLRRGEILALEGEYCTYIYGLAEGRLQGMMLSEAGRVQMLAEADYGINLKLVPALTVDLHRPR